jgi:hypothetical protein
LYRSARSLEYNAHSKKYLSFRADSSVPFYMLAAYLHNIGWAHWQNPNLKYKTKEEKKLKKPKSVITKMDLKLSASRSADLILGVLKYQTKKKKKLI